MQCNELRKHFADYVKEQLPAAVQTRLAQHLTECGSCPAELEALTDVWVKMGTLPTPEVPAAAMNSRFHEALEDYRRNPKPASQADVWYWAAGAAASVLLVFLASMFFLRGPSVVSTATVQEVDGAIYRTWGGTTDRLEPGAPIKLGEELRSEGGAVFALADGSLVEMRSKSVVTLESAVDGLRIRLKQGSVIVAAAEQREGHLYVQTKDFTVSVVGTVFLVNAEESGSHVAVIEGEVHVLQGESAQTLLPGEQVSTAPAMAVRPVAEEISWSRQAMEHVALLTQQNIVQVSPQNNGAVTGVVRGTNGMPAPGIRVYAMALRETAEPINAGNALESQAQTDVAGRYRLELAAGRYYIASGSVGAPTYYPGTTALAEARVISLAPGGLIESIDFSSFLPVARRPDGVATILPLPAGSTGVIQGIIRFPDGAPAPGISVAAVPDAALARTTAGLITATLPSRKNTTEIGITTGRLIVNGYSILRGVTDASGRYRLENVPPGTYYIAAGFADKPIFFPGTPDILAAKTFTTTPTTLADNLDFSLSAEPVGVSIKGRVRDALGGAPAAGATVYLVRAIVRGIGLPNRPTSTTVAVNADGTFETPPLLSGDYSVRTLASDGRTTTSTQNLTLADQAVSGLEIIVPTRTP